MSKTRKESFTKKVSKMGHKELVATYQYVSGQFARQQEQMSPGLKETANDMNILKHEIISRMEN